MKKLFALLVLVTYAVVVSAQDLDTLRLLYRDATQSEEKAQAFYEPLAEVTKDDQPVLVAYKGAGLMLLARYEKLTARGPKVKEAVPWIEQAVADAPENAEIRLIRLSVQEHLPKFLKYNSNIESDRQFIEQALPSVDDAGLKAMINGYFDSFSTD
ncbi:hypothetical protein [Parapedobacter sp. 10938]|uniref:hypothetical protein n=1 Tax=Parapedobacter flavus TaxID=3110225 RepID=UPI002DBF91AA|nr:hypothetical protein [Parapedobacter sp. 10938]MEC3879341.1 hypothetical protein [Parapedobacter sp. 10938]